TAHAALPAGEPHPVGSTGLGRRQRVEGATCHYLLTGDGTFRAPAADEADRPVQQRGDALLEADQVEQVDHQPDQPGDEPGEPEPADASHSGKPRDRRHAALPRLGAALHAPVLPSGSLTSIPHSSTSTTTAPSCTSTPSCSSFLEALAASRSPNVPSTVEARSSSTTRARSGSTRR